MNPAPNLDPSILLNRNIKEAPKDGTTILMLFDDSHIPYTVRWVGNHWCLTWDGYKFEFEQPVAWMHLPVIHRAPKKLQPQLRVRVVSFKESNGKRNWTAMISRQDTGWEGLVSNCGGITIAYGELWNRVAYEAERARYLLGERDTEPHILEYGEDVATPDEWTGHDPQAMHQS